MKIRWVTLVLLLTGPAAGCRSLHDDFQSYLISRQNKTLAQKAWERLGPQTCDFQHEDHYQNGFITGYMDTAAGQSGCPPALPPRKYWESTYLSSQGREQIDAWFQGYSLGASLAKLDGNAGRNRIAAPSPRAELPQNAPAEVTLGPILDEPYYPDVASSPSTGGTLQ